MNNSNRWIDIRFLNILDLQVSTPYLFEHNINCGYDEGINTQVTRTIQSMRNTYD